MKPIPLIAGLCLVAVVSCKKEKEIKVYRVAKEAPAAAQQAADPHAGVPGMTPGAATADPHAGMPGMGDASGDPHAGIPGMGGASGDPHAGLNMGQMSSVGSRPKVQVADSAPADWKKRESTSLRQLSYQLHGEEGTLADISLIILRGAAGKDLDNINRWRDEQGLPVVDAAALKDISQSFTTPAGEVVAVDIEGLPQGADPKSNGRLLGAIATRGQDAWFFRMRGNAELTAANKSAFLDWVKSVKPLEQETSDAPAVGQAAATTPAVPAATHGGADGRVTWQSPDGWNAETAAGSMRYATLVVRGADGAKAELAITHFPGDVGGDLDNVNRWRSQIGLPAVAAADLAGLVSSVSAGPKTLSFVDFTKDDKRVAAAWTRHGENTWFFKFSGPAALVGAEKAKFSAFLESIRFTASGD